MDTDCRSPCARGRREPGARSRIAESLAGEGCESLRVRATQALQRFADDLSASPLRRPRVPGAAEQFAPAPHSAGSPARRLLRRPPPAARRPVTMTGLASTARALRSPPDRSARAAGQSDLPRLIVRRRPFARLSRAHTRRSSGSQRLVLSSPRACARVRNRFAPVGSRPALAQLVQQRAQPGRSVVDVTAAYQRAIRGPIRRARRLRGVAAFLLAPAASSVPGQVLLVEAGRRARCPMQRLWQQHVRELDRARSRPASGCGPD